MPNILSRYLDARAQADEDEDQKKKRKKKAAEMAAENDEWPTATSPIQIIGSN